MPDIRTSSGSPPADLLPGADPARQRRERERESERGNTPSPAPNPGQTPDDRTRMVNTPPDAAAARRPVSRSANPGDLPDDSDGSPGDPIDFRGTGGGRQADSDVASPNDDVTD
jgi:hypothetical protein